MWGNTLQLFRLRKLEILRVAPACCVNRLSVEILNTWWQWKAILYSGWPRHTWLGGATHFSVRNMTHKMTDFSNSKTCYTCLVRTSITCITWHTVSRCYISRHATVCSGNLTVNNPRQIPQMLELQLGKPSGRKIRCIGWRWTHKSLGYINLLS